MYIFLHNAKCSKSREALKIMDQAGKKYILREYLKNPLDSLELQELQEKLKKPLIHLIRVNEKEFIDSGLTEHSDETSLLKILNRFPNLLQRPIVMDEKKAIIARPAEEVLKIFRK